MTGFLHRFVVLHNDQCERWHLLTELPSPDEFGGAVVAAVGAFDGARWAQNDAGQILRVQDTVLRRVMRAYKIELEAAEDWRHSELARLEEELSAVDETEEAAPPSETAEEVSDSDVPLEAVAAQT